jgi:hypothetical protein
MVKIWKNLKVAQYQYKRSTDKKRKNNEIKVGENVFLKVKAKRSSLKLGIFPKLAVRYGRIF